MIEIEGIAVQDWPRDEDNLAVVDVDGDVLSVAIGAGVGAGVGEAVKIQFVICQFTKIGYITFNDNPLDVSSHKLLQLW